ncbi:MAG TPA: hypothetical protein VM912_16175 [Terriglobales bacterium]|nr:hypothetical protein [Terriglobales bacterium]
MRSTSGKNRTGALAVFFVPPDVRAKAFGYGRTSALARALREILTQADLAALNAVKIASITAKEILGIQFACIEARLRHIQHGFILTPEKQGTKPSATTGLRTPYPKPCAAIVSYLVLRTRRALDCRTSDGTAIPENEEIWISPGF